MSLFQREGSEQSNDEERQAQIKEAIDYDFSGLMSDASDQARHLGVNESTWLDFADKMEARLYELVKDATTGSKLIYENSTEQQSEINPLIYSAGVLIKQAFNSLSREQVMSQLDSVLSQLDLNSTQELEKVREEKKNYSATLLKEVKELVEKFDKLPHLFGGCNSPKDLKECTLDLFRFSEKGTAVTRRVDFDVVYNNSQYWGISELAGFVSEEVDPAINYLILQKHPDLVEKLLNPTEHMQLYCIYRYPSLVGKINGLTYKAKFLAVTLDPETISLIPNADESLQLISVRAKGSCIKHIAKPSKEVQLAAVKNDIGAFDLIAKPHKDVIAYLKK